MKSPEPHAYRGRRVLVTGATGFIGRWVAHLLSASGVKTWFTTRNHEPDDIHRHCQINGQWLEVDLAAPGSFRSLFRTVQPDIVFNLAGYGVDPTERDERVANALNVRLVEEIAETVAAGLPTEWAGARLVHIGSAAEYGPVGGVLTESSPTCPVSLYGRTKLQGSTAVADICRRSGLRAIIARLFTVYGPGEHSTRLLPSLLAAALSGENIRLTAGNQRRDFTYVMDVAEGLLRLGAVTGPLPEVVNLATGQLTSVRAFAERAAELLRLRPTQLQFGKLSYSSDEVHQGPADLSLLRRLVNWAPRHSVRDGIQRTIESLSQPSGASTQIS